MLTCTFLSFLLSPAIHAQTNYARDLVNPFIGTGGHGHTFPGACVPNGLVQLSPDTRTSPTEWDGCGGYHYSDSIIYGFSHTHLSGTGCSDLCDVLLMPESGKFSFDPKDYASGFSHNNEEAHAGYYRVHLDRSMVDAELTATAHVGLHRYSFPANVAASLLLDLDHRDKVLTAHIVVVNDSEIVGERESSSWARDQHLYFCIRSNVAFASKTVEGNKAAFAYPPTANRRQLIIKVGISAVSIEGARANLEAEVPGWDFDAVRKQAEDTWNTKLSKIELEGGSREQQRIFYTALYHCYIVPSQFNDVDGNYRGMDGQVHHADHKVYTVFSLWDTFRALHPLMTILEPDMTSDFIGTFLLHYQQGGRLPVWELWGNETDCMIGYHSVSVIADAYMKGIRGFDADLALKAMVAGAMRDTPGLNAYRTKGYISSEDESESVSKTLEYAYDDACIANFKALVHHPSAADTVLSFPTRSANCDNLFDPSTGFFRARRNGGFVQPFDPFEVNFNFTEANAWQYSVFEPQDVDGMISAHGGPAGFEAHLDKLFSASTSTSGREQADITGLIGQYAHGNEPSHNVAYLYDRIGKPEKTRALVKRIMDEFYHDAPDGLIGNEDCGQMSAWFVMSALGLYQISPGIDDRYDLGYPLFPKAVIHLGDGRSWTMGVLPTGAKDPSRPTDTTNYEVRIPRSVRHAELIQGGGLWFEEDREPSPVLVPRPRGTLLDGAYISSGGARTIGAPVINAPAMTFSSSLQVEVDGAHGLCTYTDDAGPHTCPMNAPFTLEKSATVEVIWSEAYAPVTAHFTKIDGSRTIKLENPYANQYAAGGDNALIDGLRGGTDFRTGEWQGYQGVDLLAEVDLGVVKTLKRAGLSVLQDQGAWIWYPSEVTIAWSANGHQWSSTTITNTVDRKADGGMEQELWSGLIGKHARYVKVIAKNPGPCPDWHPGKGGTSWIFADEILIEAE